MFHLIQYSLSTINKHICIVLQKQHEFSDGTSALVIHVPVPILKALQKPLPRIQNRLIGELEKRLSETYVVFIAARAVMKKPVRGTLQKNPRPRSRTLTSVHENLLSDLVYPTEIVGKRTYIGLKKKLIKVYVKEKCSEL